MKQLILKSVDGKVPSSENMPKRTFREFISRFTPTKPRTGTNPNFVEYKEISCKKFVEKEIGHVDGFYICERCERFYQKGEKILVATLFNGDTIPICKNEIALGLKCQKLLYFCPFPEMARQARSVEINYEAVERGMTVSEIRDLFSAEHQNFSIVCFRCNILYEDDDEIKIEKNVLQRRGSTITCTENVLPFTECASPMIRVTPEIMAKYYEPSSRRKTKV